MVKWNPFDIYNSNMPKKKHVAHLDWEESLGNADDPDDYYEGHTMQSNITFFGAALLFIFIGLGVRLGSLQLMQGSYYRKLADTNHVRVQAVLAPRGIVYDSQGKPLVQNVPSFELVATPMDLPKEYQSEIQRLQELLKSDPSAAFDADSLAQEIASKPKNSFQAVSVLPNMNHDTAVIFEAHSNEFPGFSIQNNPIRQYLDPLVFSHIMGYTGKINDAELASRRSQQYLLNDYIGKTGLELSYENYVRGIAGQRQVEVDAVGNIKSVLGEIAPQPGDDVVLNVDGDLQRELYTEIIAKNGEKKAAAVALNPQTGQVLALISLPGYDNNLFSGGIAQADYQRLSNDPAHPLFNRAIGGTYPPGSTIKPVMASAALQENVVTPDKKIVDTGDLVVGNFHFHGWKRGGLGPMDVRSAIAWSSDIYFYTVGGGQQNLGIAGLGPERIAKYDYLFGMGQQLGIDLQGEAAGIIGSPQWRQSHYSDPVKQAWYLGDTYHISIGQGDMSVTPLQDASWIATVANGGTLYKPYIADKVVDSTNGNKVLYQNKPHAIRSGFIDPKNIEIVREGMRQTVLSGTAKILQSLPVTSAGKTGTAQFDDANPGASHAWFSAFAPYENPQIVIVVMIEAGGEGSTAAEPVVRNVLDWWAKNRFLPAHPGYAKP